VKGSVVVEKMERGAMLLGFRVVGCHTQARTLDAVM